MKPTILTIYQPHAVPFYRSIGPLSRLHQQGKINLVLCTRFDWTTVASANLVMLSAPSEESHLQVARLCSRLSVPLWVDLDDNLFDIPLDNPARAHYGMPESQKIIKECLSLATEVTTTNVCLAKVLSAYASEIRIIPNALDSRLKKRAHRERENLVLWRGSPTHDRDLETYADAIVQAAANNVGWRWHFQGYNPWRIIERINPYGIVTWDPGKPIEEYMDLICALNPSIMMVPLHDSQFNHSKSNITWIEGTYAGARTLAPNWDEWMRPGVYNYTGVESFTYNLNKMMSKQSDESSRLSRKYIEENLMLDHVNRLRLDLIYKTVKMEE